MSPKAPRSRRSKPEWSQAVAVFTPRLVRIGETIHVTRGVMFEETDCGITIDNSEARFLKGNIEQVSCRVCGASVQRG